MNNPGIKEDMWTILNQKWGRLISEGHTVNVEFKLLQGPDQSKTLAIDVVQNIDGEWVVQTVQHQAQEAYPAIGIEGFGLDQLINIASRVVDSVTEPITGHKTYDDEMHIYMKRISPETSELYGHIISEKGERIAIRSDYRHYYVINEMLEQISKIMREEYAEIQLHRNKDDQGRIYYRFVHA